MCAETSHFKCFHIRLFARDVDQRFFLQKWAPMRLAKNLPLHLLMIWNFVAKSLKESITQETEFELQSMKKETVGTAELLDQFYRVEVGDQDH